MIKRFLPLLAVIVLTGCGAASGSSTYDNMSTGYEAEEAVADYGAYDEGYSYDGEEPESESKYADKLVYTCNINIETLNYDDSVKNIKEKIKDAGGFIASENEYDNEYGWYYTDHVDSHDRNITITARIPSDKYESFLASLEGDGKITSRSSSVDNISRQYYDTEAVIKSLKIQETRLMEMMDAAETIEDMITVEGRLTEVQTQLNQYNTSLALMQTDVDYSTVYISLSEVYEYTPNMNTNTFFDRLKNTLEEAVSDFGDILENLLFFVILLIPRLIIYVPVIILIVFVAKKIRKKYKERQRKKMIARVENENKDK